MLTKTAYLQFLCCPQEFWLARNNPELFVEEKTIEFLHLVEQGNDFEALARRLSLFDRANTNLRIEFQRVFETEDLFAKSDVVITDLTSGEVSIYEIKAVLNIKKEHYADLAFQKHAAELSGVKIAKTFLVTANPGFIKNGDIIPDEMFVVTDVTAEVDAIHAETVLQIAQAFEYLDQTPQPNLAEHCASKLECKFIRHHFPDLPEYTVFEISRLNSKKRAKLLNAGVIDILHVPADFPLSEKQRRQVDLAQSGNSVIETAQIKAIIENLEYPVCFLDYETLNYAIPLFDGVKPYQQIVFQYSVRILDSPDSKPEHYEFLSTGAGNPCLDLAEALFETLSHRMGAVIVWNESFEKARNAELAAMFPQFGDFFEELSEKSFDLMTIFSEQLYVCPEFKGRFSLKKVAPALCPEIFYDELRINEGRAASIHWYWLASQRFDDERNREIYEDLLKYCELDTLATVEIFKFLKNL